ncbi:MAG: sigma-70 family RNA polymerase sigma factor [Gemmataceae bacterium]
MSQTIKDLTRRFLQQRQPLLAFLHGLVRNADVAEELLQEVWLRLAEAAEKGTEILDVGKWCRGVARNLVLHHFRGRRTAVVADSRLVELADLAFEEAQETPAQARQQWLLDCVGSLPEHSRALVRMKYGDGLRAAAIAERQGRSEEAVLKALSRVRQALEQCVEARRATEDDG